MSSHGFSDAELRKRAADLHRDADLLASGWKPKAGDLDGAPHLENWTRHYLGADRSILIGDCNNHPRIKGGTVQTSLVIAIDEAAGWMRTMGRFYTLGKPYVPTPLVPSPPSAEPEQPADDDDDALSHYPEF